MYYESNRKYTNVETGEVFTLYKDNITSNIKLVSDTTKNELINDFYVCGFDSVTIKINNRKEIKLGAGDFYFIKQGETVTHKKYAGFKNFTKIK